MTERALVTNAADPRQVKKAKQTASRIRDRERHDLRAVLDLVQGRRVIWKLLCVAGVFQVSFRAGQPDLSTFLEGRREFGLQLMADVTAIDPALYHQMAKEAQHLEQADLPTTQPPPPDEEETV